MLLQIEDKNNIEKQLLFSVGRERVDAEINSFIGEITPRVEAKGFRKGNAPPAVIRSQFKELIMAECSARLVHSEVLESIREKNLKVIGNPVLTEEFRSGNGRKHVGTFNLDGTFNFAVSADFEPSLTVIIPEALSVSEPMPSVQDMVDGDIEKIRATMAQLELVERPAELHDQVSVELLDGSNNHASINLSDVPDTFVDNSEFVGKSTNDEFEAVLKTGAISKVRITAVFARTLPAIDDEFARSAMFPSLDEMRKELLSKKATDFSAPLRAKLYHEILLQLIDSNPLDIPDRWIISEVNAICSRLGVKNLSQDRHDLVRQLRSQAERNIKSNIFLDAIYRAKESIHLSADDAFNVVEAEAKKAGRETDEVLTHLRNTGQYELLMSFHERNRTIDYLLSVATVKQEQV